MNEFCKITRPTATMEFVGRMLCRFLHIVRYQGSNLSELREDGWNWAEVLNYIRKGIVKSIFDFKEIIKGLISSPQPIN